jgi:hypothetical protein
VKKFLLKGPHVYEIRNRRANPYPETEKEFHNYFDALAFLRGFLLDRADMTTLREVLVDDLAGRSPAGLTDYEVIEQLARRLVSGQLCVAARHDRFPPGTRGSEYVKSMGRPPSMGFTPPPPTPVSGPPPLPGPSMEAAADQARALKQAAESGSHFCEA